MTPMRLLLLWRMRWGKPSSAAVKPYAQGMMLKWMARLVQSRFWRVPGLSALSWLACLGVLVLTPLVQLSDNGQIFWAAMLVLFAIGARRYEGRVYLLMLAGLTLAAALRYFYWRISSTLETHWSLDFAMGFALLVAELHLACLAIVFFGKQFVQAAGGGAAKAWDYAWELVRFYVPCSQAVFFATPLVALACQVPLVHATGALLLAFGLPYWLLVRFAHAALETRGRLTLFEFVREHLAAFAVLCRTAVAVLRTLCKQLWVALVPRKPRGRALGGRVPTRPEAALPARAALLCGSGLLLQVVVVGIALERSGWQWWWSDDAIYALYLAWVLYNAMRLLAALAAHKELAMVEHAQRQGAQLAAMVRLESGYTVTCRTVNFPAMLLSLELPLENQLSEEPLHVSIFKGYREYTFAAKLHTQQGQTVVVAIEGTCADEYQALSNDVFTRDAHWPQWLAGKHADSLLPQWVHDVIDWAETAFYNRVVRVSQRSLWQTCASWFQRGKKNGQD